MIFVSHKEVTRTPMTRQEYNDYRGWVLPADERDMGSDEGYLVEYLDGGKPNHPAHEGYISWSPKAQFDAGYTEKLDRVPEEHIHALVQTLRFSFAKIPNTTQTMCSAHLPDGFAVATGESYYISAEGYNFKEGCHWAKEDALGKAVDKLWEMNDVLLKYSGKLMEIQHV